jgi:hypothetical protein
MRIRPALRLLMLAFAVGATPIQSQSGTDIPLTLVVPHAAGGTIDSAVRSLLPQLKKESGREVVIDNKPGAVGVLGATIALRAPPDGNNVLLLSTSTAASLARNRGGPGIADTTALATVGRLPLVLAAFVYIAVALSIAIYALSIALDRYRWKRKRGKGAAATDSAADVRPPPLVTTFVVALLAFVSLTFATENDWGLPALRFAGLHVEKTSNRALLPYLFAQDYQQKLSELDHRPATKWIRCDLAHPERCEMYPYRSYVRVSVGDEVFEGSVRRYSMDGDSKGVPFLLAPACRNTSRNDVEEESWCKARASSSSPRSWNGSRSWSAAQAGAIAS